ncbi:MAG: peptidylprolyl isomerase [Terracidiphilus sp.]|jgi:peptidyl-prolyl cis-trans isomerase A (cyclophilin A)
MNTLIRRGFGCYTLRAMNAISVSLLALAALAAPLYSQQPVAPQTATASVHAAKKPVAPVSRALLNPALLKAKAPAEFKVRFLTTKGPFVVEVHREWSPFGADRFYNLAKNGFFNNGHFFRVVPDFVVQFGLSPSPAVNKVWKDAEIQDDPVTQSNHKGSVTFASRGPNTRTTQLFINLGENARLDGMGFSPFGTVIEGMDVVEKLYAGYGQTPDQGRIQAEGKPYLDKEFPLLDSIKLARIVVPPPVAKTPATAPAKN